MKQTNWVIALVQSRCEPVHLVITCRKHICCATSIGMLSVPAYEGIDTSLQSHVGSDPSIDPALTIGMLIVGYCFGIRSTVVFATRLISSLHIAAYRQGRFPLNEACEWQIVNAKPTLCPGVYDVRKGSILSPSNP